MRLDTLCTAFLSLALLAGCTGGTEDEAPPPPSGVSETEALARADKAVASLMGPLLARLNAELGKGPPEKALAVCADIAQKTTEEKAAAAGFTLRRTALRVRNPVNAPDDYERAVLERWAKAPGDPQIHREVVAAADGSRELRYLKPIVLMKICTACHGSAEEISEPVRAELAKRYPEDKAVDFRVGELRGAVSVRVPLGQ